MLFIIGGRNNTSSGNIDTSSVDRYDPLRDEWKPMAPLSVARNRLGVAVIDDCIYAVGGGNGNTFHTSMEKYDPKQDEWTTVTPLNFPRIGRFYMLFQAEIARVASFTSWRVGKKLLLKIYSLSHQFGHLCSKVTNLVTCVQHFWIQHDTYQCFIVIIFTFFSG